MDKGLMVCSVSLDLDLRYVLSDALPIFAIRALKVTACKKDVELGLQGAIRSGACIYLLGVMACETHLQTGRYICCRLQNHDASPCPPSIVPLHGRPFAAGLLESVFTAQCAFYCRITAAVLWRMAALLRDLLAHC